MAKQPNYVECALGTAQVAQELYLLEDLPSKLSSAWAWVNLASAHLSRAVSCMGGYQRM